MYITWYQIELRYAGKTYSRRYLNKEDLHIEDLRLWSEVPLE